MANELHNAIMNIPAVPPEDANINQVLSYKAGHRDARHAAAELALAIPPAATPAAPGEVLAYVLQDEQHNRLTPRVIDIAYTAFMIAKQPNAEDGGSSDWFNDARPAVEKAIKKMRDDFAALSNPAPVAAPAPASGAVAVGRVVFYPRQLAPGVDWLSNVDIRNGATLYTVPPRPPGDSADAPVQQAGPDDSDMVNAAYCLHKYRQGTDNGIAFNRGARWMRAALKGEQPVEPSCGERGEV